LLEKENQGDRQRVREVIEAIGSNPVGAVLIVMKLLACHAECVGQLLLRHAEQQSAHPHAGADMGVDGVGGAVRGHANRCRSGDRLGHRIHLVCAATPFRIAASPRNPSSTPRSQAAEISTVRAARLSKPNKATAAARRCAAILRCP
jgi:hypothetical protein